MQSSFLRRVPLRRISPRRRAEQEAYGPRAATFLLQHPYCQVWLAERGISEDFAREHRGILDLGFGVPRVFVPRSEVIHHRNKRRGPRLLDESEWMAVSHAAHRRIENNKAWARDRGYLRPF